MDRNCVSSTLLCWSLICLHKNHRKKEKNHNKLTLQMPGSFVTSQPLISLEPVEVTDRSWNSKTIQERIIYGLIWPSSFSSLTKKDKALDPCINYPGLISTAVCQRWKDVGTMGLYNTAFKYLLNLACEWWKTLNKCTGNQRFEPEFSLPVTTPLFCPELNTLLFELI